MSEAPTRRAVLAGVLALATPGAARAAGTPRLAALDWGLAATAVRLGLGPAGIAECAQYARWVQDPALPPGTIELGLRVAPSFEALAALRPDAILVNALNESLRPRLDAIAPTLALPIYIEARQPFAQARAATLDLGQRFGRAETAARLLDATDDLIEQARAALGPAPRRAVLVFAFADAHHIRPFGAGSLFADVLSRLGLVSAWRGPTSPWGAGLADLTAVADYPEADLLAVAPVPAEVRRKLDRPGLWASLLAGRPGRFLVLPPAWAYGELTAAQRFAALAVQALTGGGAHAG